jgi:hypothetical protein
MMRIIIDCHEPLGEAHISDAQIISKVTGDGILPQLAVSNVRLIHTESLPRADAERPLGLSKAMLHLVARSNSTPPVEQPWVATDWTCVTCGAELTDETESKGLIFISQTVAGKSGSAPVCTNCWEAAQPGRVPHRVAALRNA